MTQIAATNDTPLKDYENMKREDKKLKKEYESPEMDVIQFDFSSIMYDNPIDSSGVGWEEEEDVEF